MYDMTILVDISFNHLQILGWKGSPFKKYNLSMAFQKKP